VDDPPTSVVLVDTDVFSFIFKGSPEANFFLTHMRGAIPAVSFVTIAELYKGAYARNWSARKIGSLEKKLQQYLILPYDLAVAQQWARIQTAIRGRTFPQNDAWVAACALTYGCPLLTNNARDFHDIPGLTVISP